MGVKINGKEVTREEFRAYVYAILEAKKEQEEQQEQEEQEQE